MMSANPERRRNARTLVLQSGRICEEATCISTECRVLNWSELGALLQVSDTVVLPASFILEIRGKSRPAAVRWRHGRDVGVCFLVQDAPMAEVDYELAGALYYERVENASLKKRERQL